MATVANASSGWHGSHQFESPSWPQGGKATCDLWMSAIPPKADICDAQTHVRFGPKSDKAHRNKMYFIAAKSAKGEKSRRIAPATLKAFGFP
jgi:hypothetical protein